jgi:hypothetical protein
MGYCRKCGTKLEDDMAYCPKCGTPVAVQERYQRVRHEEKLLSSVAIVGIVLVCVAVVAIALVIVGLIPAIGIGAPVIGSGNVQTQQKDLTDFTAVEAGAGFNVQITQGSTYSVSVTTDDNILQYIEVNKAGSTLTIGLRPSLGYQTTTLKAEITMPDLQEAQFSGGVVANAAGFNMTHNFRADLSGGSRLTMAGQAADLTATCSGGANIDLSDFKVTNANVDFSGGSQGTINLDGRLDANLSGGARLFYIGNPTLGTINTSGGATISKATS